MLQKCLWPREKSLQGTRKGKVVLKAKSQHVYFRPKESKTIVSIKLHVSWYDRRSFSFSHKWNIRNRAMMNIVLQKIRKATSCHGRLLARVANVVPSTWLANSCHHAWPLAMLLEADWSPATSGKHYVGPSWCKGRTSQETTAISLLSHSNKSKTRNSWLHPGSTKSSAT